VRRQQVAYARSRGLSGRRACALLAVARSTIGYVLLLIARDAPIVPPMRTLAAQYPRYGYRTIRIFLERRFRDRTEAKVSIEQWRRHYNEVRPHSSLGYLTPAAFTAKHLVDRDGRLALTLRRTKKVYPVRSAPFPVTSGPKKAGRSA
jgi:transposase InsO family protein